MVKLCHAGYVTASPATSLVCFIARAVTVSGSNRHPAVTVTSISVTTTCRCITLDCKRPINVVYAVRVIARHAVLGQGLASLMRNTPEGKKWTASPKLPTATAVFRPYKNGGI